MTWGEYVILGLVLASAIALVLYRERAAAGARDFSAFLVDVRGEVLKITWPTRDDLRKATMVILLFVVLVALVIGIMDVVLQFVLVKLPAPSA